MRAIKRGTIRAPFWERQKSKNRRLPAGRRAAATIRRNDPMRRPLIVPVMLPIMKRSVMSPVAPPVMPVVRPIRFPGMFAQTAVARRYRRRTIMGESVPSGAGISVAGDGVPDLLALHRAWGLREGVVCQEQNSADKKHEPQHAGLCVGYSRASALKFPDVTVRDRRPSCAIRQCKALAPVPLTMFPRPRAGSHAAPVERRCARAGLCR
jgi:hypothetical protein